MIYLVGFIGFIIIIMLGSIVYVLYEIGERLDIISNLLRRIYED